MSINREEKYKNLTINQPIRIAVDYFLLNKPHKPGEQSLPPKRQKGRSKKKVVKKSQSPPSLSPPSVSPPSVSPPSVSPPSVSPPSVSPPSVSPPSVSPPSVSPPSVSPPSVSPPSVSPPSVSPPSVSPPSVSPPSVSPPSVSPPSVSPPSVSPPSVSPPSVSPPSVSPPSVSPPSVSPPSLSSPSLSQSPPPLTARYIITPENMKEMCKGPYILEGMPRGIIYAFLKINKKIVSEKWNRTFEEGTILAWVRAEGGSGHRGQMELMGLKMGDIIKAGLFSIDEEGLILHWNLRTGTFWELCKLDKEGAQNDVGLPLPVFRSAEKSISSPQFNEIMKKEIELNRPSTARRAPLALEDESGNSRKGVLRSSSGGLTLFFARPNKVKPDDNKPNSLPEANSKESQTESRTQIEIMEESGSLVTSNSSETISPNSVSSQTSPTSESERFESLVSDSSGTISQNSPSSQASSTSESEVERVDIDRGCCCKVL